MKPIIALGITFILAQTIPAIGFTVFTDDFSSDKGWESYPPSDIIRNIDDNTVHWHVDRSYDQRMYKSIESLSGDFDLRFDAKIDDATNNCHLDVGLVNDIDKVRESSRLLIRIGFFGGGTPYPHWYACLHGKYSDGSEFYSTSGELDPTIDTWSGYIPIKAGEWYSFRLTKSGNNIILTAYSQSVPGAIIADGRVSCSLNGVFEPFNFIYIGNWDTGDWPSANGELDNIELSELRDRCDYHDTISLRDLADRIGLYIGSAVKTPYLKDGSESDPLYEDTLVREFNMLTPEYEMKFDMIWPVLEGDPQSTLSERMMKTTPKFEAGDKICALANENNMVVRGHTLIWHNALPKWLTKLEDGETNRIWTRDDRDELLKIMYTHIYTTISHYQELKPSPIICWDVVNEAIADPDPVTAAPSSPPTGTTTTMPKTTTAIKKAHSYRLRQDSIWYMGIGEDYIDLAFQYAHAADMKDGNKDFKLFYNDYGGEAWNQKADDIYNLVRDLHNRGVPIDGVGLQMHIYDMNNNPVDNGLAENIQRLTDLGLEVHITEMEVWPKAPATVQDLEKQARIYKDVLDICLKNRMVTAFVVWGFTDRYVYIDLKENPVWKCGVNQPFIFDEFYHKKPAYCSLQEVLRNRTTTSTRTTTAPSTGTTTPTTTTTDDIIMPKTGKVVVKFKSKSAAFDNEFRLFRPMDKAILKAIDANVGKSFDLGSFPAGTRLIFGLKTPEGVTYYTDHSLNDDACDHVIKVQTGSYKWELRWEDLYGLGDKDYNDVVIEIEVV